MMVVLLGQARRTVIGEVLWSLCRRGALELVEIGETS